MLKTWQTVFWYELLLSFRRSHEWLYPLMFFAIILCLFPIVISSDPAFLKIIAPGAIWIAAMLASVLGLEHMLQSDIEEGYLEQLLLNHQPLGILILAKMSAHWFVTQLPLICFVPVLGWLFHLPQQSILALTAALLLGTPILSLLGALGVALTLGLRHQGVLLGLLIFPLVIPVLIFGVSIVKQSEVGLPISGNLALLGALLLLTVCFIPWVLGAVLRLGMDD